MFSVFRQQILRAGNTDEIETGTLNLNSLADDHFGTTPFPIEKGPSIEP
jgi:hypothetical protein